LCPITKQWVDLHSAKDIINTRSPNHNYCALVLQHSDDTPNSNSNDRSIDISSATISSDASKNTSLLDQIGLRFGDRTIYYTMLNSDGQQLVRPILQDFVNHMNDIELARQCIIDLCT
jgi:hypothetical protein